MIPEVFNEVQGVAVAGGAVGASWVGAYVAVKTSIKFLARDLETMREAHKEDRVANRADMDSAFSRIREMEVNTRLHEHRITQLEVKHHE